MKNYFILFIDMLSVLIATSIGIVLRDNLEFSYSRFVDLSPYLTATLISSTLALPAFGINRMIWRYSSPPDYLRILNMSAVMTIGSLAICFAINRLDGVPRSLPFLQFNLALTLLIGARILYRRHHLGRRSRQERMAPLKIVDQPATETVLLVGLSPLTETYLQALKELASPNVKVAGILGHKYQHIGRTVASHKILGTAEGIDGVLSELNVSGVVVDRVIVATPLRSLSGQAVEALRAAKQSRAVQIRYLSDELGFEPDPNNHVAHPTVAPEQSRREDKAFLIQDCVLRNMQQRQYWKAKRLVDIVGSASLLICLCPIMLIIALALLAGVGGPVVFWQQRPGLGGRPFRLLKFRTMGPAFSSDGRELSDQERVSRLGQFLRRTRLDELPQLFNILRGDMSFIGPRPLLPRDQDTAFRARLLVRPGLTGWAQVVGGRAISAGDKAALDVWYVKHASLRLDFKVVLKTIPMVVLGETISRHQIESAWNDLRKAGMLGAKLAMPDKRHERRAA